MEKRYHVAMATHLSEPEWNLVPLQSSTTDVVDELQFWKGRFESRQTRRDVDSSQIRITVVGTLPPPICGTTVSMRALIKELGARPGVSLEVINTGSIRRAGWLAAPVRFVRLLVRLLNATRRTDVVS